MLAQIGVLIVYVLLQMVIAAQLATIYFRVFFLDQLLRHGRVSIGLWLMTAVQILVMAFAMVLIFERIMLFLFPDAPESSWFWLNVRMMIVTSTFIGNFFMQMIDDRKRLAAVLADKDLMERMRRANEEKENKSKKL
jgi:hypothetical protein